MWLLSDEGKTVKQKEHVQDVEEGAVDQGTVHRCRVGHTCFNVVRKVKAQNGSF